MHVLTARVLSFVEFVVAGILLAVAGWVSYHQMDRLSQAQELVDHTLIVREETEVVLSLLKDAETGERGYIITGAPEYLEPYRSAVPRIATQTEQLRNLTRDNAPQQANLAKLSELIKTRLSELGKGVSARQQQGFGAASATVRTNIGKHTMDDIRTLISSMRDEENRLFVERQAALKQSARIATVVNSGSLGSASILILFATVLLLKSKRQQDAEHAARSQADAVAAASMEAETRLRVTLQSIGDGVIAADDQGRIVLMNPVAQALAGWTEAGAQGHALEEVFTIINETTRQPVENPVTKVLREGGIVGMANHTVLVARDGREIPIDDSGAPIKAASGEMLGVVIVFRDVTQQRQIDRQLATLLDSEQAARSAAEVANRAKDQFVATVSHELRSPLNSIVGWIHILRQRGVDSEVAKGLEVMERNTRIQLQLIDDLIDMSRIVTGKLRLEMGIVDLRVVTQAALDIVRPAALAKEIHLETYYGDSLPTVAGDADRLQQAVWNLLSNAIRFTPKGGRIEVWVEQHQSEAQIRVRDTGVGIRPEFLPHIFERFWQGDSSSSRTYSGLGIGLSLVRHLVDLHGGTVTVESEGEGRGATFAINLPIRSISSASELSSVGTIEAVGIDQTQPLKGLHILVADDDADTQNFLRLILTKSAAEVTTVSSAAEALIVFDSAKVDALVSDIGMPGESGYELIKSVRTRKRGADLPAVALTAYARPEDREKALDAGFNLHIAKPIDPAILIRGVARVCGRINQGSSI